jgi:hypothetical protein
VVWANTRTYIFATKIEGDDACAGDIVAGVMGKFGTWIMERRPGMERFWYLWGPVVRPPVLALVMLCVPKV